MGWKYFLGLWKKTFCMFIGFKKCFPPLFSLCSFNFLPRKIQDPNRALKIKKKKTRSQYVRNTWTHVLDLSDVLIAPC